MKKILKSLLLLLVTITMLSGCTNAAKVKEIENRIFEVSEEIYSKEKLLEEWEDVYKKACETYYAPHSSNEAVQSELERTKEIMDDAFKEVNELTRDIDLLELEKELAEKQLEELMK